MSLFFTQFLITHNMSIYNIIGFNTAKAVKETFIMLFVFFLMEMTSYDHCMLLLHGKEQQEHSAEFLLLCNFVIIN